MFEEQKTVKETSNLSADDILVEAFYCISTTEFAANANVLSLVRENNDFRKACAWIQLFSGKSKEECEAHSFYRCFANEFEARQAFDDGISSLQTKKSDLMNALQSGLILFQDAEPKKLSFGDDNDHFSDATYEIYRSIGPL